MQDVPSSDNYEEVYHEQAERDSLNSAGGRARGLLELLSGRSSAASMLDRQEPFHQLWLALSGLYGKLLVVLMLAFCLTEVMDNNVGLLSLQGVFLLYLYVGSIGVIICIYMWVLIDSCAALSAPPPDPEAPPTRFGSLKRAHISRAKTSSTSFYLRVGALAFGLGTLVFNGLEMAMHSMMEGSCLSDVVFVHPVLHGLFTFLQMHFLFVNAQVLVDRFGVAARFGFMHLAATNLALWVRLVVWESGNEWAYYVHLATAAPRAPGAAPTPLHLRGFPRSLMARHPRDLTFSSNITARYRPISEDHIVQVVALHECLNTNSLGQLWTSSMPFLYPFIVQFSLIAAAVTFVLGSQVGAPRKTCSAHKKLNASGTTGSVDCGGASKGLFLGLLCLVAGVVVIIIFLVVKEDAHFPADTVFWLTSGTETALVSLSLCMTALGLSQLRRLSVARASRGKGPLDAVLGAAAVGGAMLYCVFSAVVGAAGLWGSHEPQRHVMLLSLSLLQLLQVVAQAALVDEALCRAALTRHQALLRPGRQVVTFLLCANAALWAFDTFVAQSWVSQELQLRFFGVLAWGVVARVGLPLLVFYRFHACVLLLHVWKRSYRH